MITGLGCAWARLFARVLGSEHNQRLKNAAPLLKLALRRADHTPAAHCPADRRRYLHNQAGADQVGGEVAGG